MKLSKVFMACLVVTTASFVVAQQPDPTKPPPPGAKPPPPPGAKRHLQTSVGKFLTILDLFDLYCENIIFLSCNPPCENRPKLSKKFCENARLAVLGYH